MAPHTFPSVPWNGVRYQDFNIVLGSPQSFGSFPMSLHEFIFLSIFFLQACLWSIKVCLVSIFLQKISSGLESLVLTLESVAFWYILFDSTGSPKMWKDQTKRLRFDYCSLQATDCGLHAALFWKTNGTQDPRDWLERRGDATCTVHVTNISSAEYTRWAFPLPLSPSPKSNVLSEATAGSAGQEEPVVVKCIPIDTQAADR